MPRGLNSVVLFSITMFLAAGSGDQTAQPPVPSRPPDTKAATKPWKPRTVELDLLAALGNDDPVVVLSETSENFLAVLKNRAPGATYHVRHDWVLPPEPKSIPPPGALHAEQDLGITSMNQFTLQHRSPECDELQTRVFDVLRAVDEPEAQARVKAFKDKGEEVPCPLLSAFENQVQRAMSSPLGSFTLDPGHEVRYVVDRIDPASRAVLKTWRFVVRPPPPRLEWVYANEEAWIVGETSRDIAEMLVYARDHSLPGGPGLAWAVAAEPSGDAKTIRYALSSPALQGGRRTLSFPDHIWSPSSYEPLAADLIRLFGLKPQGSSGDDRILVALSDPRSPILERESQRVSRKLENAMLDPGAQEQAALILGTLGLREAAGRFSDTRQTLCRMAAHLALARSLRRGAASPLAGYADALLITLVNRQKDALERIQALGNVPAIVGGEAFLRALRMRNAGDWRILASPADASLLERLECYRALEARVGSSRAQDFLESFRPEELGDWGRIAFEYGASVEEGNHLLPSLLPTELRDVRETWQAFWGTSLAGDKLIDALNARPERAISSAGETAVPRVIGWGIWGRFFQRNICYGTFASVHFLRKSLGLKDDARALRTTFTGQFSDLALWPRLESEWRQMEYAEKSRLPHPSEIGTSPPAGGVVGTAGARGGELCSRAVELAQKTPELLTAEAWGALVDECWEAQARELIPPATRWFNPVVPAGTALLDDGRAFVGVRAHVDMKKAYSAAHELAPFDRDFLEEVSPGPGAGDDSEATGDSPGRSEYVSGDVERLYGPLAEYDLAAMKRIAATRRGDPDAYRALYEKIAALDPDNYPSLGNYLVDAGLEDEAAAAYEKAIEKARDRVHVSNNVLWLVGYYCDRGRTQKAGEVAQMAAEVYSARGLRTRGYYAERLGRYADAEEWYRKIAERYDGSRDLDAFYIRYEHRVADGRFQSQAAAALGRLFPSGLDRVSVDEMVSPPGPMEGVKVSGRQARSTRFGLRKGDRVVALNGYRLTNNDQYQLLWTFDDRPEATVIVWRDGRYVEIKGVLKHLRYDPISASS